MCFTASRTKSKDPGGHRSSNFQPSKLEGYFIGKKTIPEYYALE